MIGSRPRGMPSSCSARIFEILLALPLVLGAFPADGVLAAQDAPGQGSTPAGTPGAADRTGEAVPFSVFEATISELQEAMEQRRVTAVELVDRYLARIEAYDQRGPALNSIIRLNPDARSEAAARDREREAGRVRGSLHGIPVVVKDNYDVRGLPTSAATLVLAGLMPPDDAFQVRKLREAGAVILAKTNLHELASGITTISSLGGQTRNPYDPARNPGGSSGGTGAAVAASFAAVGWGSDTCGSIRIPSALNNLFGLRPTKGLSSIDGIIPLSHSQDTGGPLARTMTDLALALDATVGHDPADPATDRVRERQIPSFMEALDPGALEGARIGTLEAWLEEGEVSAVVRGALDRMADAGAEIVPVELPGMEELLGGASLISHEFKFDLEDYLSSVPDSPVDSLGQILDAGLHHEALDRVLRAWNGTPARDSEARREAVRRQEELEAALQALLVERDLDAISYPSIRSEGALIGQPATGSSCSLSAHSGLPALSLPAGFTSAGVPVGLELLGRSMDDQRLVAMAYAFEQIDAPRRAPFRTPPLEGGRAPGARVFALAGSEGEAAAAAGTPELVGTFALDLAAGELRYDVVAPTTDPAEVHGLTLERREGDDPHAVVRRLGGPGRASASGILRLSPPLFRDLVRGNLAVGLYTVDAPLGAARRLLEADPGTPPRRPFQETGPSRLDPPR